MGNTFKWTDYVIIQSHSHNKITSFKKHNVLLQMLLLYHVVAKKEEKKKTPKLFLACIRVLTLTNSNSVWTYRKQGYK